MFLIIEFENSYNYKNYDILQFQGGNLKYKIDFKAASLFDT